jgi:hypothetical protein
LSCQCIKLVSKRQLDAALQQELTFTDHVSARIIIGGIETMHMIRKGQMNCPEGSTMSAAQLFYSLAV